MARAAIGLVAAIGAAHESRAAHRPPKPPRSSAPISGNPDSKAKAASEVGIPLSLTDAVSLALRDNRTIRGATIDRITQKFALRVAEDGFMPHLGLSGGAVRQTIAGITTTSLDVSPGVSALLPTGATVAFSWANHASEGAGIRTRSTGSVLSIEQPLLRGGGVDVTLAPLRSARLGEQANRLRLKATVSETIGQVIYAYRDLLRAQKAMVLAQAAVRRAEEILDINRALIDAGRTAAVEIVQSEADLENQRLGVLGATRSLDSTRLRLLDLLALDLGTPILATESTEPPQVATHLPHLMEVAFAQRPDYLGQLLVLAAAVFHRRLHTDFHARPTCPLKFTFAGVDAFKIVQPFLRALHCVWSTRQTSTLTSWCAPPAAGWRARMHGWSPLFRWLHQRRGTLRTSMITAALLAVFGAAALTKTASAAPLSPAPAVAVAGAQDNITDARWHPIRRMHRAERRFVRRHFHRR